MKKKIAIIAILVLIVVAVAVSYVAVDYIYSNHLCRIETGINGSGMEYNSSQNVLKYSDKRLWYIGLLLPIFSALLLIVGMIVRKLAAVSSAAMAINVIAAFHFAYKFIEFNNPNELTQAFILLMIPCATMLVASFVGIFYADNPKERTNISA